jgi:hypothetical protein
LADADVTRRALTLGARDSTTGWPAKSYTESTIKGSFDPGTVRALTQAAGMPLGGVPYTSSPFYTANYVARGDRIVTAASDEYELTMVTPIYYLDQFVMYACTAEKLWERSDRASTSGTWHTDSESVTTDPRNRIKTWIDTYISHSGPIDITVFAGGDYPLEREFTELHTDLLVAIDTVQSTPVYDYKHEPYKFTETVTLTCSQYDNSTYSAVNTLESYEQSIRNLATDYPIGSIRRIVSSKPERVNIGGLWLWQNNITIEYTRVNDDYDGSGASVTWGPSASATGTFTFPNITYLSNPVKVNNTRLMPPGRMGNVLQKLGMPDAMITMRCDLDMEPDSLTWKRPQTTTPKTDVLDWQVFLDIAFTGQYDADETYQTLNLGWGGTMQVTLEEVTPVESESGRELELVFYTYNSASGSAYKTWFGISP